MVTKRPTTRRAKALAEGDLELAEALRPPSERPLSEDEKCGALAAGSGRPCRNRRGSGTDHPGYGTCARHGGNTPAGVKSAMRLMGKDLMLKYKSDYLRFGGDRNDPTIANLTPESALLEEVRRSAAMVRFLEERIALWNLNEVQADTIEQFASLPPRTNKNPQADKYKNTRKSLTGKVDQILHDLPNDNPDSPGYLPPLTDKHPTTGIVSFTDAREWLYLYREERGHLARTAKLCIDAGVASRLVSIAEDQGRILSSAIRAILSALDLTPDQQSRIPVIVPTVLRAVATDQPVPSIPQLLALTSGTFASQGGD